MIYLINFFARKIEAVSKQVEDSRQNKKSPIITCCYFLGQKPLRINDIKDNIWIFPKSIYPIISFIAIIFTKDNIHIYEDESSWWRLFAFNIRKRNIYITLFKDININLVNYINKIKYVKKIIVEDSESFLYLNKNIKNNILIKQLYPSPLWSIKKHNNLLTKNIVFASWNGGDINTLKDRGVYDLLKIIKINPLYSCTIITRDNEIKVLMNLVNKWKITNRTKIIFTKSYTCVKKHILKSDYVYLSPRVAIMKYVPNSIIDGLSQSKPCIISNKLRFSNEVKINKIGLIFDYKNINNFKFPDNKEYCELSKNVYKWSKKFLLFPYKKSIKKIYEY